MANAGSMAKSARKKEPGRVTHDKMQSRYTTVYFPGMTPGINPPFCFSCSAIMVGFIVTAV